jgi:Protein of unknown function (DUF3618)
MGTSTDQLTAAELRQQLEQHRTEIGRDLVAIGDRVSPRRMTERRVAAVREKVARARVAVMGAADEASGTVRGAAETARERVSGTGEAISETASSAAERLSSAPEQVRETTQGNPLAAGLIAFGAGLLISSIVPPTSREQQLVGQAEPQLERAARGARRGRPVPPPRGGGGQGGPQGGRQRRCVDGQRPSPRGRPGHR